MPWKKTYKRLRKRIRHPLETAAFFAGLTVIPLLPQRALSALARFSGRLAFHLDRRGRVVGEANLKIAFDGEKSPEEQRQILRASYCTIARTLLDMLWLHRHTDRRISRLMKFDPSTDPLFHDKRQIIVSAHFSNWEAFGLALARRGLVLHSIAMPVKNPRVDQKITTLRETTGQQIIPRAGALIKLLRILRKNGKVAFLADQNTSEKEGGLWVDFFGLPTPITSAPAMLAAKTGSEIVVAFAQPQQDGGYTVRLTARFDPPARQDQEAIQQLTQALTTEIERQIRQHPECWLWTYKNWREIPFGANRVAFPFYAG